MQPAITARQAVLGSAYSTGIQFVCFAGLRPRRWPPRRGNVELHVTAVNMAVFT